MKQLGTLSEALVKLKDDSQDYSIVVEREGDSLEKLSQESGHDLAEGGLVRRSQ